MSAQPERIAEAIPLEEHRLARAKQASFQDEVQSKLAPASFDVALVPLEARAGKELRGPWRKKWEAHFDESPEGFLRVRDDVLARQWVRSTFAYFNKLLDDGDHVRPAPKPVSDCTPERCYCGECKR